MKRRTVVVPGLAMVLLVGVTGFSQEKAKNETDRYAVPAGSVAEQIEFIKNLSQIRPASVDEDLRHRAKFRPALQQAAERILSLEQDRSSEAYQAAEFIALANRARWLAQADPDQQRKIVVDVKAYLKRKLGTGESKQAVDLAVATGRVLLAAGRADLAVDASKEVLPLLRQSSDTNLRGLADAMDETVRAIASWAKDIRQESLTNPFPPEGRLVPLDLQSKANRQTAVISISEDFPGNGLAELGQGDKVLGGIRFCVGPKLIHVAGGIAQGLPKKVEGIPVHRAIARLYVLQAAQFNADDGTALGQYTVRYEDGSTASVPIVYGQDLRNWWASDMGKPVTRGKVVWTGSNRDSDKSGILLRLYLGAWQNPRPETRVAQLDFKSTGTSSAPFCVAITVEEPK